MPGRATAAGVILAVALAGAALAGCRNKARENLETFHRAEAAYQEARRLVTEGKVKEAGHAYAKAQDLLLELRQRAGGVPEGADPLDGDEVAGFTPKDWQERWKQGFKDHLRLEFSTLKALAARGVLEREDAYDFLSRHEPQLAEQWADEPKPPPQYGPELYSVECTATESGTCDLLFEVLTRRLARPTRQERLPAAARPSAWGLVEVSSWTRSWAGADAPAAAAQGSALSVFQLPRSMEVVIKVTTRGSKTSWDGEKRLTVVAEPPTKVEDVPAAHQRQLEVLREKMVREINALPRQTVEP